MIIQKSRAIAIGILVAVNYCFFLVSYPATAKQGNAVLENENRPLALLSQAEIVDLTQTLNAAVPSYDGKTENFKYQTLSTVDKDGYGSGAFFTHEHLGTHVDAPIHFCNDGLPIDKINPNDLLLAGVVIDVREEVKKDSDYLLSIEKIKEFEKNNNIPSHSAVLLLSGWSKRYFIDGQYRNADSKGFMHYPGFSIEAAKYLIDTRKVAVLGIDTLSIDNGPSKDFVVHKFVLSKGLFMAENLTNLEQLPRNGAVIVFAPLKLEGGTGSPARVLAIIPKREIN